MSEARILCEGALHQSAEWTLWKGFLTPVYAEGMERVFLATEIQGFLIRNRAALRSTELWALNRCTFLKRDPVAMIQYAQSVMVPQRASDNVTEHAGDVRPETDAGSCDLAGATFSWCNSWRSLGKSLSSGRLPGELGLFVTSIYIPDAVVRIMSPA